MNGSHDMIQSSNLEDILKSTTIAIPDFDTLIDMIDPSYDSFSNTTAPMGETVTGTIEKKMEVEVDIQSIYEDLLAEGSDKIPTLDRRAHAMYSHGFLSHPLPSMFVGLDASKTWICYWLMNSASLLGVGITDKQKTDAAKLLLHIKNTALFNSDEYTGFGGGPNQLPHLAASYAAVLSLALTGDKEAWAQVDRVKLRRWILSMKQPDGSFSMHKGGESDTRAAYCALCIAALFDLLDDEITANLAQWIIKCQTYEGGFGGDHGDEAHGGYTYCALAVLLILMTPEELLSSDLNFGNLVKWTVDRQYSMEGGFSGRSNKLVDGCYSHWIGGTVAMLELVLNSKKDESNYSTLVDRQRLQNYILCCCQDRMGLRDKPGCKSDFYHTNYVLCGLSMTQYFQVFDAQKADAKCRAFASHPIKIESSDIIDLKPENKLKPLDSIFGLPYGVAESMYDFFAAPK